MRKSKNRPSSSPPAASRPPASLERIPSRRRKLAAGTLIVLVAMAAYLPAFSAGYLWDDSGFLYENALIHAPDGLQRFWFTTEPVDYFPLTSTMLWLEWRIWGNDPHGYHAVNIVLHALAAVVLWRVLARLKLPGAYLAALLFAVHPVTAASVAWISERKNTLSMVLFLLSLLAWLRFEDANRKKSYAAAWLLFAAAMLAKTSVACLPAVLLILAWWRRGSVSRTDVARSLPFFAVGILLAGVTVWFHYSKPSGVAAMSYGSFASRLALTGWVVWFYLYKILLPINLVMIYPRWEVDGGQVISYLPLAALAAGMLVLWRYRKGWGRGGLAAMAYFLAGVFPVAGLFQMSYSQHSYVSDHLQYVPMIGILAWLAGAGVFLAGRLKAPASVSRLCATSLVLLLATLTWFQSRTFTNLYTLFGRNLEYNDQAWSAAYGMAGWYSKHNSLPQAIRYLDRTLELNPRCIEAASNRAGYYAQLGQIDRAIADFTTAIGLSPKVAPLYNNRADAYLKKGEPVKALEDCVEAIKVEPKFAMAHHTKAEAHFALGQIPEARKELQAARDLGMKPDPQFLDKLQKANQQ